MRYSSWDNDKVKPYRLHGRELTTIIFLLIAIILIGITIPLMIVVPDVTILAKFFSIFMFLIILLILCVVTYFSYKKYKILFFVFPEYLEIHDNEIDVRKVYYEKQDIQFYRKKMYGNKGYTYFRDTMCIVNLEPSVHKRTEEISYWCSKRKSLAFQIELTNAIKAYDIKQKRGFEFELDNDNENKRIRHVEDQQLTFGERAWKILPMIVMVAAAFVLCIRLLDFSELLSNGNLFSSCFLTGKEYEKRPYEIEYVKRVKYGGKGNGSKIYFYNSEDSSKNMAPNTSKNDSLFLNYQQTNNGVVFTNYRHQFEYWTGDTRICFRVPKAEKHEGFQSNYVDDTGGISFDNEKIMLWNWEELKTHDIKLPSIPEYSRINAIRYVNILDVFLMDLDNVYLYRIDTETNEVINYQVVYENWSGHYDKTSIYQTADEIVLMSNMFSKTPATALRMNKKTFETRETILEDKIVIAGIGTSSIYLLDDNNLLLEKYNINLELEETYSYFQDIFEFTKYNETYQYEIYLESFTIQGDWLHGVTDKEIIKINLATGEDIRISIKDRKTTDDDYFYFPRKNY